MHNIDSYRFTTQTITATSALSLLVDYYIIGNGAVNITLTLPDPTSCNGKMYVISRNAGSTGTITLTTTGGQIQALNGTLGATSSIGAHSAAGAGVDIRIWSNGINWYR